MFGALTHKCDLDLRGQALGLVHNLIHVGVQFYEVIKLKSSEKVMTETK